LLIDGTINIDFIRQHKQIHEVKKSKSIEEASIWQVKYYLYYLKNLGMEGISGIIDYPLIRRNVVVELEENDELKIQELIANIEHIVSLPVPPTTEKMKICSQCAYFELCFI
jgi:CRISPR-associated exonuclease Cas4